MQFLLILIYCYCCFGCLFYDAASTSGYRALQATYARDLLQFETFVPSSLPY